jgi:lipopolysaccharide transport system permease protein
MQFWYWFTPIVNPAAILPPEVRSLLGWNPMARVIQAYQQVLVKGTAPDWSDLLPVLLVQLLLALGIGMIAGVLNVFFRDVGQFVTIAMQFWFWFTPVVYPAAILPPEVRHLLGYNPMARVIEAFQDVLVKGAAPDWAGLLPVLVLALLLCALGLRLFRRRAGEMVDEL